MKSNKQHPSYIPDFHEHNFFSLNKAPWTPQKDAEEVVGFPFTLQHHSPLRSGQGGRALTLLCCTEHCKRALTMLNGALHETMQITTVTGSSAQCHFSPKILVLYAGNCMWVLVFFHGKSHAAVFIGSRLASYERKEYYAPFISRASYTPSNNDIINRARKGS